MKKTLIILSAIAVAFIAMAQTVEVTYTGPIETQKIEALKSAWIEAGKPYPLTQWATNHVRFKLSDEVWAAYSKKLSDIRDNLDGQTPEQLEVHKALLTATPAQVAACKAALGLE